MKIFSFCIYGFDLKYYLGLVENIRIINKYYPDYYIYLYYGIDNLNNILENIKNNFKNIKLLPTNKNGAINMILRYLPIIDDDVEITIIRDADSEVNERDRWCINDFLSKNNKFFSNTLNA